MLTEKALTMTLSISQWTGRKYDNRVTHEIDTLHGTSDTGRFNKLLVDKAALSKIQNVVSKARAFHYDNTLPWGDDGARLLPSSNYFIYMEKMVELEQEFRKEVFQFLQKWDLLVSESRKRLADMFNSGDYPSEHELKKKFDFKVSAMPVPEADFRVQLGEEEVKKLKASMELEINSRLSKAAADSWDRIKRQLTHMKEKLTEKDIPRGGGFRDSLFTNLEELVQTLPRLNVTEDPKITEICEDMKALVAVDPKDIRKNQEVRKNTAEQVENILNKYSKFL